MHIKRNEEIKQGICRDDCSYYEKSTLDIRWFLPLPDKLLATDLRHYSPPSQSVPSPLLIAICSHLAL